MRVPGAVDADRSRAAAAASPPGTSIAPRRSTRCRGGARSRRRSAVRRRTRRPLRRHRRRALEVERRRVRHPRAAQAQRVRSQRARPARARACRARPVEFRQPSPRAGGLALPHGHAVPLPSPAQNASPVRPRFSSTNSRCAFTPNRSSSPSRSRSIAAIEDEPAIPAGRSGANAAAPRFSYRSARVPPNVPITSRSPSWSRSFAASRSVRSPSCTGAANAPPPWFHSTFRLAIDDATRSRSPSASKSSASTRVSAENGATTTGAANDETAQVHVDAQRRRARRARCPDRRRRRRRPGSSRCLSRPRPRAARTAPTSRRRCSARRRTRWRSSRRGRCARRRRCRRLPTADAFELARCAIGAPKLPPRFTSTRIPLVPWPWISMSRSPSASTSARRRPRICVVAPSTVTGGASVPSPRFQRTAIPLYHCKTRSSSPSPSRSPSARYDPATTGDGSKRSPRTCRRRGCAARRGRRSPGRGRRRRRGR